MLALRDYQAESVQAVYTDWAAGNTRTAVVMATGLGKTVVFCHIAKDRKDLGKTLILVHRDELAQSAATKMHSVDPTAQVGIVKAERNEVDAQIIVGSVQTLRNPARRSQIENVATIIVDEAHHAIADSYMTILEHFGAFQGIVGADPGATPTVGFSATLARDDHRGLARVWQNVCYTRPVLWGIAKGHLVDVKAKRVTLEDLDLGRIKVSHGDYQEDEVGKALLGINAGPRIAEAWTEHARERQGFLFTPNVATTHQFAADFERAGIRTAVITGATPQQERLEAYSAFQKGQVQVLVNCMVLTEGFDMPQASVACIARATRSRNLYVQMAGRVLRPWPGKTDALLLDVVGVTKDQKLASIVDLAEDKIREIKDDETITDAIDREGREKDSPVSDLGGSLRARDVDLFHLSDKAWLRTEKGVWFIPTARSTYFLWPETELPGTFWIGQHSRDAKAFRRVESGMMLEYARAWAEELAISEDPSIASRTSSWRTKRAKPSEAQIGFAQKLKIIIRPDMTKDELSDQISIKLASRLLDRKVTW